MVGDAREHFMQIGFGIEAVEFCRTDQAVDGRRPLPACIRSGKLVVLAPQGHAAQRAFGGVVVCALIRYHHSTPVKIRAG
jgi:hypothetical protein